MKLADYLKQYRKENNLTQQELADKLFVSKQAVSKWETERGLPDIETYKSLSTLLNISVDELLGLEKQERKNIKKVLIISSAVLIVLSVLTTIIILIVKNKNNVEIVDNQKELIIAKTEEELRQELPNIRDYNYIDYYEWKMQGVLYLPVYMYYFVFEKDIQIDFTWLDYLSDELIINIPVYLGDLPAEYDYFKVLDLNSGAINYIELDDNVVHTYVLYAYNIVDKRLISICFEV